MYAGSLAEGSASHCQEDVTKACIVHDRNQRGAGLALSCLSPSIPFRPPRLLAQDWGPPYLRGVSVSFGNTPTDSSQKYAPPTCPGDPKANLIDN